MKPVAGQYLPLMLFQLVLMVLYFVFVKYDGTPKEVTTELGTKVLKTDGTQDYNVRGFEDTHVMIFIGFGFLMTFLKKYCYSALGLNLLLAALSIQWAILCQNFFHMEDGKIILTKKLLLEADIMSATVLITFGALLGVASSFQLLFISVIEIALGCINLWIVADILKAADVGGSIAIHAFGAYFGLGASLGLRQKKKEVEDTQQNGSGWVAPATLNAPSYSSDVTAMIGTLFLWIYWPSFNSALTSTDYEYQRAVINTYLSLASATVTTFFLSVVLTHQHKFDMVHVQNSTLAGGVAVGSVCNMYVGPGGAVAIGIGAGVISVLGYVYLTPALAKFGILDTCGVNNLHGMPGVYSGLLSILFAYLATPAQYGQTDLDNIFPVGAGNPQALNQFLAVLVTLAIAFVGGLVSGLLSKLLPSLKEEEKYSDEPNWELPA